MKRFGLIIFIAGLLFCLLFSLSGCGGGGGSDSDTPGGTDGETGSNGWTVTVIDSNATASNGQINAALDALGKLHISYYDDTHLVLKYATNKGGTWSVVSVDTGSASANLPGEQNDIAVAGNGNAYISYHNADNNGADGFNFEGLCYATNVSGSWFKQYVFSPTSGVQIVGNSIAVDNLGKVHIAFYKSGETVGGHPYVAKYTDNVAGSWLMDPETVGAMAWDGLGICLALDGSSNPYVAYTYGYGSLYAANRSGGWSSSSQLIAGDPTKSSDEDAMFPAMAIDPSAGRYLIFYNNNGTGSLELSVNSGIPSVLAADIGSGYFTAPAIAFDGAHKAHISYCNTNGSYTLHYVTNKSGSWVDTSLAIKAGSGNSAIAVSASNMVYIVYASQDNRLTVAAKQF